LVNPYLIRHAVDGMPDLQPESFEVLFGPEFHNEEFDDGAPKRLPTLAEIERQFGYQAGWASL
jgi:hypothetical protein